MSFSTDLDAVRERAGLPVVRRVHCSYCDESLVTIKSERVDHFIAVHAMLGTKIDLYEGLGRFRIKRFPLGSSTDPVWPWRVHDADRPGVFGRARTHAAAVELVGIMLDRPGAHGVVTDEDDEVIAYVNGVVPRDPFDYPPAIVRRHA